MLVFFSLSGTKLPHYVLYGYAPLVLLSARALAGAGRRLRAAVWLSVVVWAGAMAWLPGQMQTISGSLADPLYRALISGSPAPGWAGPAIALGLLLALALAGVLRRPPSGQGGAPTTDVSAALLSAGSGRLGLAGLVVTLWLGLWAAPWWGEALQGPVHRAAESARAHAVATGQAVAVVQYRLHLPSFAVYLGQPVPRRDPQPAELALTRVDRLTDADLSRPRLFEERGLILLGPQP